MSTLDINSIRDYLIEVGCKVEYPILVNAFKKHLYNPDPNIQGRVRTQFKDYVNRLSTVNVENNMKFITLRPEFRPASFQQPTQKQQISPQQNGLALRQQHKHQQHQQQQSTPIPMMTSSPKRPDNVPQRLTTNSNGHTPAGIGPIRPQPLQLQRQPEPVAIPQPQLPPPPLLPLQLQPRNDRLDSPRIQQQHPYLLLQQQQQDHFQQQQSLPTPPPVPQHHRPLPMVDYSQQQHPQQSLNAHASIRPTKPSVSQQNDPQSNNNQRHHHISPSNQQQHHHHHFRSHSQPMSRQEPVHQSQQQHNHHFQQQLSQPMLAQEGSKHSSSSNNNNERLNAMMMPPPSTPPSPLQQRQHLSISHQSSLDRQSSSMQVLNTQLQQAATVGTGEQMMPPPRPPPRRRQSTASLFKPSPIKPIEKTPREMHDQARKSIFGRVRDYAQRSNSSASANDLSSLMAKRNSSMKENRLSRDSTFSSLSSALQRDGSHLTYLSRSSHRGEDESDSSSLQPIDPLKRRWAIEACNCNYNNLVVLLREDPKLAPCKDILNGYTAIHWAAKFGNLDIIKILAGPYGLSVNIKSSAGHTPLHVAYMFNRLEAANLLLQNFQANPDIRDHFGKKPMQYWRKPDATKT